MNVGAKTEKATHCVVATRLINSRDAAITFHLEPWGEEFEMPPTAIFQVVARGPDGDSLEVVVGDEHITVWGWPGSIVKLFHEGVELGAGRWERGAVPSMPPLKESTKRTDHPALPVV